MLKITSARRDNGRRLSLVQIILISFSSCASRKRTRPRRLYFCDTFDVSFSNESAIKIGRNERFGAIKMIWTRSKAGKKVRPRTSANRASLSRKPNLGRTLHFGTLRERDSLARERRHFGRLWQFLSYGATRAFRVAARTIDLNRNVT